LHLLAHLAEQTLVDRLTRHVRIGGEEEVVEHASLPRCHRGGAGRGEIGHGQKVKIAQTFAPMNLARELADRRLVFQIAARGHVVHEKVLQDEMAALVDVFRGKAEAREDVTRHVGASLRVVFATNGFAHIVKQRGQEEHGGARHLGGEPAREGIVIGQIAPDERAQPIHRRHRVHVDRVDMVEVVVNSADHRRKLRDHRHEQTDVVQLAQHRALPEARFLGGRGELHEE
jgi:hypothetical protein